MQLYSSSSLHALITDKINQFCYPADEQQMYRNKPLLTH